jgi:predicted PurR-regulated permease PerM
MNYDNSLTKRFVYVLLAIILFLYAIIVAKDFLYPITLAVLFSYMLYPVVNFFEKKNIPRILAILISLALGIALISGIIILLYKRLFVFVDNLPALKAQALTNLKFLEAFINDKFGFAELKLVEFVRLRITDLFEGGNNVLPKMFSATAGLIFKTFILPVYIFLFLYYRTKFAHFFIKVVPVGKKFTAVKILKEISSVATRYLGGMFLVVLIVSSLNIIGLAVIGVKNPVLFGAMAGIFTFIPYFGTFIGGMIPFTFVLLTSGNPLDCIHVVFLIVIVHFIENNFLTPNIVGNNVNLNPFIIILSIIGAGKIWGIPGMFAVVPLLAMLKIAFEHIETLKPYYFLLGTTGTKKHALSIQNIKIYINRLKNRTNKPKS